MRKIRLAVWKFASCDGCQLSLLDCEEELLPLSEAVEVAYFLEASRRVEKGPYHISLVEGSITTPHDVERIKRIRRASRYLIAIGACATAGGIQALRNLRDVEEFTSLVYARPEYIDTLKDSTPVSHHVKVDLELRGCPINKHQLLYVLISLLNGRTPSIPSHSLCLECKMKDNVCVMVSEGVPCMGPVTHGGCGAICPSYRRGCYGCYGPSETVNMESLGRWWIERYGMEREELVRRLRTFNIEGALAPFARSFEGEGA